jgi:hypothetical protein
MLSMITTKLEELQKSLLGNTDKDITRDRIVVSTNEPEEQPKSLMHWSEIAICEILNTSANKRLRCHQEAMNNLGTAEKLFHIACSEQPSKEARRYAEDLGYSNMLDE